MNKVQHVKWCMKQTKLNSEISCTTDSCLAQLVEHLSDDPESCGFRPHWGAICDEIYFFFSVTLDLSDNLTEMCQFSLS